jgi:hypothetical protein
MPEPADRHAGPLDRLISAYHRVLGRAGREAIPPPPDPATYVPDMSPPTPDEQARAAAAAREAIRQLREKTPRG